MITQVVAACWLQLLLLLVVPTRSFSPRVAPDTRKVIQTPSHCSRPRWSLPASSPSRPTEALAPEIDDDDALGDEKVESLLSNILSVCIELQDTPQKFLPPWIDDVEIVQAENKSKLVTTREIETGDIISLLPIDDLRLSFDEDDYDDTSNAEEGLGNDDDSHQIVMPLLVYHHGEPQKYGICTNIDPRKDSRRAPGWLGHLATTSEEDSSNVGSNCVVLPVMGAAPLCALVAAQIIPAGTELVVYDRPIDNPDFYNYVISKQFTDVQALAALISRAYHDTLFEPGILLDDGSTDDDETSTDTSNNPTNFQFPFYSINWEYPGLRYLHYDPDILVIDNFLTDQECDSILQQCESQLKPCVTRHPVTGEIRQDPRRTSTNAELRQEDAPDIVEKLVQLTQAQHPSYFEKFQVLKYEAGQAFVPHTDGFPGKTTAGGFEDSGRLITIFCYLKDVPEGGETRFTKLSSEEPTGEALSIAPRKGMAVIHFPATIGLEEDPRTEHEGYPAVDEKWLLVTWLWKDRRKDLPPNPQDN